jgi:O-antigen/teichoic acid export membrane protein
MPDKPEHVPPAPVGGSRWARLQATLRRDAGRLFTTGVPHVFSAMFLTQGMSFVRRVLLARLLDKAELGQMTFVMQIADTLVMLTDLGITTALLKYASEPGSDERKRELYGAALFWGALFALGAAGVYAVFVWIVPIHDVPRVQVFLLMVVPYILVGSIAKVPTVYLQALKRMKTVAGLTCVVQGIALLATVGAVWQFGLWGLFFVVGIAPLAQLASVIWLTRRHLTWTTRPQQMLRAFLRLGVASVLANATGTVNALGVVLLLKYLTGSDVAVGVFSIAVIIRNGIQMLPMALLRTAFPYLSGIMNEPDRFQRRIRELVLKCVGVMLAIGLVWVVGGRWILPFVFGSEHLDSLASSIILTVGVVPFAAAAPTAQALIVMDRVLYNVYAGLIQLLATMGSCIWLIPLWGATGAAVSLLVGQCVYVVVARLFYNRARANWAAQTVSAPDENAGGGGGVAQ